MPESPYLGFELSLLAFHSRVLEQAADESLPLLERFRFLSIFGANLDEFFMLRVGDLADRIRSGRTQAGNAGADDAEAVLSEALARVRSLSARRDALLEALWPSLAGAGIVRKTYDCLSKAEKRFIRAHFRRELQPLLSPQIVDARHPFPHMENQALYVVAALKSTDGNGLGVLPVPRAAGRLIRLPDGVSFVLCEDLLLHRLAEIFPNYKTDGRCVVRVTRNADLDCVEGFEEDERVDVRRALKKKLKRRERLAPMRLQVYGKLRPALKKQLATRIALKDGLIFHELAPLDLSFGPSLEQLFAAGRALVYPPFRPRQNALLPGRSALRRICGGDVLLHFPYESMSALLRILGEAAEDPDVLSVKISLYRLGPRSQVVAQLCAAAENGKEVTVVLELRARFDENSNLSWSARLEEAGCRVVYGVERLKVHAKLLLITRRESGHLRYITYIGTGNFNEDTARCYTDIGWLTARRELGEDAALFFRSLPILNLSDGYKRLFVSPNGMRNKLTGLLDAEIDKAAAGASSGVLAKMNALTDPFIIDKLLEAGRAGVPVRLIVRGVCCLRPAEGVRVISIVGRFLEHSRVFAFGGAGERRIFLSSADWMTRSLDRRVEIASEVDDVALRARLDGMLELMWRDDVKASELLSDGSYLRRTPGEYPVDSQRTLAGEEA